MSKRVADKQMTQENWDDKEESEEAGVFKLASQEVMKERKVIKPKRKLEGGESTGGSGGAFKGFGGFTSMKPATEGASSLFSFGTGTKTLSGLSNGSETKPAETSLFSVKPASQKDSTEDKSEESTKRVTNGVKKSENTNRSKYLQQLKCLNESVAKWIKQHVDKNAYCILTPIFKDYEKHLADIEKSNPDNQQSEGSGAGEKIEEKKAESEQKDDKTDESATMKEKEHSTTATGLFSFGSSATSTTTTSSDKAPSGAGTSLFSFSSSKSTSSTTGSVFGGAAAGGASGASSGFSFGSATVKPFSFATGSASSGSASNDTDNQPAAANEEEYVPPKAEVSEIKEDDALYSKRCKMYYQKDGTWVEKGVGNLHLKPCSGKTQLLIRADTNLGNILLNIMLSDQIPFARQGKNNVSFMCIPNPPIDPKEKENKPTSILLRVKTSADADELLEKINEHKGS